MGNVLTQVNGGYADNGRYSISVKFADQVDPGSYRARIFLYVDGTNDLSSSTGTGMYAIPENPCDRIEYDDWSSLFRPEYRVASLDSHNHSFNVETVWGFSGDSQEHAIAFCDENGVAAQVTGESLFNGEFDADNLPVNFLVERRVSEAGVDRVSYSASAGRVTVHTVQPHGFRDGDAVTISGLPRTDHSMGVHGERFNGTYRITVLSSDTFCYTTMFYPGFAGYNTEYVDYQGVTASRWVVVEYCTSRETMCSLAEAIVIWPGHTLTAGDRITLCDDSAIVAENALVASPATNTFICRSPGIALGSQVNTVVYAPRTPIWEIPVNYVDYSVVEPGEPVRSSKKSSGSVTDKFPMNMVFNGSRLRASETSVRVAPSVVAGFDLTGQPSESDGPIEISSAKFAAIRFSPVFGLSALEDNSFRISFRVLSSTEVSTELCMYRITENSWTPDTDAAMVYGLVSRVPMGNAEITTPDNSCDYIGTARVFSVDIGKDVADRWVSSAEQVSLAFVIHGRPGAVVTVDRDSFTITRSVGDGTGGEVVPLPVKAEPSLATPGDTVTVYSLNTGKFTSNPSSLRIKFGNEGEPETWTPIINSEGESIAFVMPEGHAGRNTVTVMQQVSGNWVQVSEPVVLEAYNMVSSVVKLNDRMRPGEIGRTVSYSATYNRDLSYNGFAEITDENSIIQNLYSCLLTRRGERLFNKDFGTSLEEMVFSLRGTYGDNAVLKECLDAISTYEPRITLIYEQCRVEDVGSHGVRLILGVEVPGGTVQTISIPFKNRGRLV